MKTLIKTTTGVAVLSACLVACSGDSSPSGRYIGQVPENPVGMEGLEFDFRDESNVVYTIVGGGGQRHDMDCTYTSGETRISVSCFGSSGISLSRVGKDLETDMDGMVIRFAKH